VVDATGQGINLKTDDLPKHSAQRECLAGRYRSRV